MLVITSSWKGANSITGTECAEVSPLFQPGDQNYKFYHK